MQGNVVEVSFWGADGKPTLPVDEYYASIRYEYDDQRNLIFESYYDLEGTPCYGKNDAGQVRYTYDDAGRLTRVLFFSPEGLPNDNLFCQQILYDDFGNIEFLAHYDKNGNPLEIPGGTFVIHLSYDERGRLSDQIPYDKNMNINNKDIRYKLEYNKMGSLSQCYVYNPDDGKTLLLDGADCILDIGKFGVIQAIINTRIRLL
jgi:YD repeat-containing protein